MDRSHPPFRNDELLVDTIVDKFSKTLHVSAPSLPRHNSSTDLPSELPAELLSAPLIWIRWGVLFHLFSCSMTAPMRSCATAPAPSPSESSRGTRVVAVSRLKACTATDTTSGSPHCRVTMADCWAPSQAVLLRLSKRFLHARDTSHQRAPPKRLDL